MVQSTRRTLIKGAAAAVGTLSIPFHMGGVLID
jgi:hypothetical protein